MARPQPRGGLLSPKNDASGAEALRRGLADAVVRWPVAQAEWREVIARLIDGRPFEGADEPEPVAITSDLPRFAGARVLVVDDSAVNREVATEALAQLGITVDTAEDGRAAIASIMAQHYDAVLMDGSMPGLDGYEATRLVRAEEQRSGRPRLCIIALTAHVVGAQAEAWRQAGMDGVLHKPFKLAQLAACLRPHLKEGRADQADGRAGRVLGGGVAHR